MAQAIAGVVSDKEKETTVMTVWPSIGATAYGRWWGRRFENQLGITLFGVPITVGRLMALASIPFILLPYFHMLTPRLPFIVFGVPNAGCRRYRLTNRRVIVEQAFGGVSSRASRATDSSRWKSRPSPDRLGIRPATLSFATGRSKPSVSRGSPTRRHSGIRA